jgi:hypothetical protein
MGLMDEPICIACGMEDESDTSENAHIFEPGLGRWGILGAPGSALLRFALTSGRFTVAPWFIHSYEHFFFLHCLILSVCLFVSSLIFRVFMARVRRFYLAHSQSIHPSCKQTQNEPNFGNFWEIFKVFYCIKYDTNMLDPPFALTNS